MYHVLLAVSRGHEPAPGDLVDTVTDLPSADDDVEATVLNVFEEFEVRDESARVSSADLYDETDLPDAVTAARDRLSAAGVPTAVRREHGDPAAVILDVAQELAVDAVVLQGRKRTPIGKALFGSVTQGVLLGADRPAVVVPTE